MEASERASDEFLSALAAPDPVPGGGAAAAYALAMGAALLAMAARGGGWDGAAGAASQALALERRVAEARERNLRAYEAALAALGRRAEERGREGDFDIGDALADVLAELVPLAEAAADIATLGAEIAERGDAARRPDAVTAVLLAEAAARAAEALIAANLAAQEGDREIEAARTCVRAAVEAREAVTRRE